MKKGVGEMEFNDILQAISTVGFPIVCCGVMFWNNYQMQKQHKSESDNFATALNNNTLALQKLTIMLEGKE